MAIDRETIVSFHKKSESNSTIAKEGSKSSGRQARHPIDQARAERKQFEPSELLKTRGKS